MADILVKHLVKRFGKVEAVSDVSLKIADGEFLVLLGPSGCGKSTILRVVAGLEDADGGEIVIGGRLVNFIDPVKRNVAMVFQNYALYPHLTVYKNVAFPLQIAKKRKGEVEAAVRRAAGILGLEDLLQRLPGQLSGGQRQRVALARAIVREPDAFLMDEPLSNLDAQLRLQTRLELIQLHQRLGITTMYVTHDQVEAMTMGDRIAVMSEGVLQQIGTPQEVYRRPANVFVATFLGSPPMNLIGGLLESTVDGWRFRGEDIDVALSADVISARALEHEAETGGEVKLGLRPEHFRIGPPGQDGGIAGRVQFLEPVGSDLYLTVEAGGTSIQVRTDPDSPLKQGENLSLLFHASGVHVFGADGRSLRRDAPPVGSAPALITTTS
ncbi:MAG: ABC transporter ATP-binding protein [Gaiella sp.]